MMHKDLRIQSLLNAYNKEDLDETHTSRRGSLKSSEIEWDFTSGSDSDSFAGQKQQQTSSMKKKSKLTRVNSISFADRDQVVEFPPGSEPLTPTAVMKRIQSKSSFDWDFSDEEHNSKSKASPNRSPLTSGGVRRINFADKPAAAPPGGRLGKPVQASTASAKGEKLRENLELRPTPRIRETDELGRARKNGVATMTAEPEKVEIPGEEITTLVVNPNWTEAVQSQIINEEEKATKASVDEKSPLNNLDSQSMNSLKRVTSKTSLISTYDFLKDKVGASVPPTLKKTSDSTKLTFVVAFFFLVICLVIGFAQVFYAQYRGERRIFGNVKFEEHHGTIKVFDGKGQTIIEGHVGVGLHNDNDHPYRCKGHIDTESEKCLEWHRRARLTISHTKDEAFGINCYKMFWKSLNPAVSPTDCFSFGDGQGHWYGGGESLRGSWPLEKGHIKRTAFITGDEGQTEWGNAIKKYFANSNGVIVTIADHTPLFLSIDEEHGLCIQAKFDDFAYFYHRFNLPRLNYTICTGGSDTLDGQGDIRNLHKHFLPKSFWHGQKFEDISTLESVLKKPLWQVPASQGLTHESLKKYLSTLFGPPSSSKNVTDRGYLLLDYHWQESMGDLEFNNISFPNVPETIKLVNETGLKLVLTINPFVSTKSSNFGFGVDQEYFVKERNSTAHRVPALTWFKDISSAGLLDITSNSTIKWLKSKLRALAALDQESIMFYLETGNTFHIPTYYEFGEPLDNPDMFRDFFVKHCMSEVSVIGVSGASSKRPKAPAFIFLSPLESTWESLQSIIPNMLQMSVVGYPYVNPGAVGGVGIFKENQAGNVDYELQTQNFTEAEKEAQLELYIRWWQLNTFMPMLHFLKPPTAFPEEKIGDIATKLKQIRLEILPHLIQFSTEAMRSSEPVIRPLWMLDPHDYPNQVIDDEFLIGDRILVAPVLKPGERHRNIYLPRIPKTSKWDQDSAWMSSDGTLYQGGRWLNYTKVDLSQVPYFVRLSHDPLSRPSSQN